MAELRKWGCFNCRYEFYVSCDDDNYPEYCPHCGLDDVRKDKQAATVRVD